MWRLIIATSAFVTISLGNDVGNCFKTFTDRAVQCVGPYASNSLTTEACKRICLSERLKCGAVVYNSSKQKCYLYPHGFYVIEYQRRSSGMTASRLISDRVAAVDSKVSPMSDSDQPKVLHTRTAKESLARIPSRTIIQTQREQPKFGQIAEERLWIRAEYPETPFASVTSSNRTVILSKRPSNSKERSKRRSSKEYNLRERRNNNYPTAQASQTYGNGYHIPTNTRYSQPNQGTAQTYWPADGNGDQTNTLNCNDNIPKLVQCSGYNTYVLQWPFTEECGGATESTTRSTTTPSTTTPSPTTPTTTTPSPTVPTTTTTPTPTTTSTTPTTTTTLPEGGAVLLL